MSGKSSGLQHNDRACNQETNTRWAQCNKNLIKSWLYQNKPGSNITLAEISRVCAYLVVCCTRRQQRPGSDSCLYPVKLYLLSSKKYVEKKKLMQLLKASKFFPLLET